MKKVKTVRETELRPKRNKIAPPQRPFLSKDEVQRQSYISLVINMTPECRDKLTALGPDFIAKMIEKEHNKLRESMRCELLRDGSSNGQHALIGQQLIDERSEMVEEALDECCQAAMIAGLGIGDGIVYADMEDQVRSILVTAANLWSISRDVTQFEQD